MTLQDKIKAVHAKYAQINALHAEIDEMLDPLCRKVMERGNVYEIETLINQLPTGFHRTELRTYLNMVKNGKSS